MPKTLEVQNPKVIPLFNELAKALLWLKPGKLSWKVSRIKDACEKPAMQYQKAKEAMIDDLVEFEPQEEGKQRVRKKRLHPTGVEVWDFGANETEFERRDRELSDAVTEITVPTMLTEADIEAFEKQRVDKAPVDAQGKVVAGVDFSLLMPVIELEDAPAPKAKAKTEPPPVEE